VHPGEYGSNPSEVARLVQNAPGLTIVLFGSHVTLGKMVMLSDCGPNPAGGAILMAASRREWSVCAIEAVTDLFQQAVG
jgi:hypothetical protein